MVSSHAVSFVFSGFYITTYLFLMKITPTIAQTANPPKDPITIPAINPLFDFLPPTYKIKMAVIHLGEYQCITYSLWMFFNFLIMLSHGKNRECKKYNLLHSIYVKFWPQRFSMITLFTFLNLPFVFKGIAYTRHLTKEAGNRVSKLRLQINI